MSDSVSCEIHRAVWLTFRIEAVAPEACAGLPVFVPRPPMRLNTCSSDIATVAILMSFPAGGLHRCSRSPGFSVHNPPERADDHRCALVEPADRTAIIQLMGEDTLTSHSSISKKIAPEEVARPLLLALFPSRAMLSSMRPAKSGCDTESGGLHRKVRTQPLGHAHGRASGTGIEVEVHSLNSGLRIDPRQCLHRSTAILRQAYLW
jgi:hypothetical protein